MDNITCNYTNTIPNAAVHVIVTADSANMTDASLFFFYIGVYLRGYVGQTVGHLAIEDDYPTCASSALGDKVGVWAVYGENLGQVEVDVSITIRSQSGALLSPDTPYLAIQERNTFFTFGMPMWHDGERSVTFAVQLPANSTESLESIEGLSWDLEDCLLFNANKPFNTSRYIPSNATNATTEIVFNLGVQPAGSAVNVGLLTVRGPTSQSIVVSYSLGEAKGSSGVIVGAAFAVVFSVLLVAGMAVLALKHIQRPSEFEDI